MVATVPAGTRTSNSGAPCGSVATDVTVWSKVSRLTRVSVPPPASTTTSGEYVGAPGRTSMTTEVGAAAASAGPGTGGAAPRAPPATTARPRSDASQPAPRRRVRTLVHIASVTHAFGARSSPALGRLLHRCRSPPRSGSTVEVSSPPHPRSHSCGCSGQHGRGSPWRARPPSWRHHCWCPSRHRRSAPRLPCSPSPSRSPRRRSPSRAPRASTPVGSRSRSRGAGRPRSSCSTAATTPATSRRTSRPSSARTT